MVFILSTKYLKKWSQSDFSDVKSGRAGVTVSDYPPVQVTPGGNLKLVSSYPPPPL